MAYGVDHEQIANSLPAPGVGREWMPPGAGRSRSAPHDSNSSSIRLDEPRGWAGTLRATCSTSHRTGAARASFQRTVGGRTDSEFSRERTHSKQYSSRRRYVTIVGRLMGCQRVAKLVSRTIWSIEACGRVSVHVTDCNSVARRAMTRDQSGKCARSARNLCPRSNVLTI